MQVVTSADDWSAISASGNISAVPCFLQGIFVSSSSGGTIAIYDDAATGTSIPAVAQFSATAATWYPLQMKLAKGLNVVVGGTLAATVMFNKGGPFLMQT